MKEFVITFRYTNDRGYRTDDCFILQAEDIKEAKKMARVILRTTHDLIDVMERIK